MYAIINKKTGAFLYGTDFRYNPPHQRTSKDKMKTYDCIVSAKSDMMYRKCGKNYCVVKIEVIIKENVPDNFLYNAILNFENSYRNDVNEL